MKRAKKTEVGQAEDGVALTFVLSKEEAKRIENLLREHRKGRPGKGRSHRILSYIFTPTEIDTVAKIKCSCGKIIFVRDDAFASWISDLSNRF